MGWWIAWLVDVDVGMWDRQDKENGINCGLTGRVYDIMI
jgi:hypothetical protein